MAIVFPSRPGVTNKICLLESICPVESVMPRRRSCSGSSFERRVPKMSRCFAGVNGSFQQGSLLYAPQTPHNPWHHGSPQKETPNFWETSNTETYMHGTCAAYTEIGSLHRCLWLPMLPELGSHWEGLYRKCREPTAIMEVWQLKVRAGPSESITMRLTRRQKVRIHIGRWRTEPTKRQYGLGCRRSELSRWTPMTVAVHALAGPSCLSRLPNASKVASERETLRVHSRCN